MRRRIRYVLIIAAVAILLLVAAAVLLVFSDFGSTKEPVINGMRLRRYVGYGGPLMGDGKPLAQVGGEAIPWLIKGLEAEDSAFTG